MGRNKKEIIREAAIKVMAELGYHHSTTDRIAQEAGLAVGTIYNYFGNKEEILEYIFAVEVEKRQTAFEKQLQSEKPIFEKLEALLELHFSEIAKNIAAGQILVRERQHPGKKEANGISAFLDGVPQLIQALLDTALEQGEIRPGSTRLLAAAIFGAVQEVAATAVFSQDKQLQKEILENAASELVHFFSLGMKASP
ncbi:MAG: TetR/AcrR family transcriptional regulator [Firmicutes bacterium]|nr:TetR/AcrR family transcriptional regulator [Bacillota bacterium]